MNEPLTHTQRASRTGIAVIAAGALMIGAAWHSLAADTQKPAATVSTPITHSIAGGRDSYADVVSVAAPAVVTIRTEGKARISPTDSTTARTQARTQAICSAVSSAISSDSAASADFAHSASRVSGRWDRA